MKPHPRIRKTIKWGGAAVTVLLVVVWIGSGWFELAWEGGDWRSVAVFGGVIELSRAPQRARVIRNNAAGFRYRTVASWRRWWFSHGVLGAGEYLYVPLWLPSLGSLAVAGFAWRLDTLARRRARVGLCPKCNYDRAGLAAGAKCPECGSGGAAP